MLYLTRKTFYKINKNSIDVGVVALRKVVLSLFSPIKIIECFPQKLLLHRRMFYTLYVSTSITYHACSYKQKELRKVCIIFKVLLKKAFWPKRKEI